MHMCVRRKSFVNPCYFHIELGVRSDYFVDRIFITKIFFCFLFSEHYRKGIAQRGLWISFHHIERKNIKQIFIREIYILFIDEFVFITKRDSSVIQETRHLLNFGKISW